MIAKVALAIIIVVVAVVIQVVYANHMKNAAIRKGYGDDAHAWAMCFWLGIIGGIYVLSLPDLIQQNQIQQLIELVKMEDGKND